MEDLKEIPNDLGQWSSIEIGDSSCHYFIWNHRGTNVDMAIWMNCIQGSIYSYSLKVIFLFASIVGIMPVTAWLISAGWLAVWLAGLTQHFASQFS